MITVKKKAISYEVACRHCKSVIAFEREDVKSTSYTYPWNPIIICPVCGTEIDVMDRNDSMLPSVDVITEENGSIYDDES